MDIQGIIHWATSTDWGTLIVAILAMLGALDLFLLALLKVSNLLWPSVTWDDNIVTMIHSWLSKITGWLGKLGKKE